MKQIYQQGGRAVKVKMEIYNREKEMISDGKTR